MAIALVALSLAAAPLLAQPCVGDCDGDGVVTVDENVRAVNIALGSAGRNSCPAADADGSGDVTVEELVGAVNSALLGCGSAPTPTGRPSPPNPTSPAVPSRTPSATPVVTPGAGLEGGITAVSFAAGDAGTSVVVTFTLTDAVGVPVAPVLGGTQNPAQARVRFTVAHIEEYSGGGDFDNVFSRYVNDIDVTRPKYDSGGVLAVVDASRGIHRYTFKQRLAPDFDPGRTYSVGMQADRTVEGRQLGVNSIFDAVPGGGSPQVRAAVETSACNTCHAPLIAHGNRREVRLCLLCHTEAAVDEKGRSVDFRDMVHKIHAGKDLPSVAAGAPGSTYAIFSSFLRSDVVFAEKDATGAVTGVGFPRALQDCEVCHAQGPTQAYYRERPSTAACATCHDDVNPSVHTTAAGPPGTNHVQGIGFPEGDCRFCHVAATETEFDVSVPGAHVVPGRSRQLKGLQVRIDGIESHAAGETPTVSFRVTEGAGVPLRDLASLNRLAFTFAGPTRDYATASTATAVGGGSSGTLTGPDAAGVFRYVPAAALPADAAGTWAVGAEARRTVSLQAGSGLPPRTFEEAAENPLLTFSVDGSTAEVRRSVVDDAKCGRCHGTFSKDFSIHGNLRNATQFCVTCHNPNASDAARRRRDAEAVAGGEQTATIDFKVLIHKLHSGVELQQKPYIVYGFGPAPPAGTGYSAIDFSEVRFPGDRRDCEGCHRPGTYWLPPFPGPAQGTRTAHLDPATGNEVVDGRVGPISAVCTSCHDSDEALAHVETQTAGNGVEACAVCHEEGRAFPLSGLHEGRR